MISYATPYRPEHLKHDIIYSIPSEENHGIGLRENFDKLGSNQQEKVARRVLEFKNHGLFSSLVDAFLGLPTLFNLLARHGTSK